jgi:hypothetical protein
MRVGYRDAGSGLRIGDRDNRIQFAGKSLDKTGAQTRLRFVRFIALQDTNTVIIDGELPVGAIRLVIDANATGLSFGKSMLQCVDHQLGDDQPQAHRNVCADNALIRRYAEGELIVIPDHGSPPGFGRAG